jgi:hypothetical protein
MLETDPEVADLFGAVRVSADEAKLHGRQAYGVRWR